MGGVWRAWKFVRTVRILSVVDAYTRECVAVEANFSLGLGACDAGA